MYLHIHSYVSVECNKNDVIEMLTIYRCGWYILRFTTRYNFVPAFHFVIDSRWMPSLFITFHLLIVDISLVNLKLFCECQYSLYPFDDEVKWLQNRRMDTVNYINNIMNRKRVFNELFIVLYLRPEQPIFRETEQEREREKKKLNHLCVTQ